MKVTSFQTRVYEQAKLIPEGSVTTYGALAVALNCGSAQAVGQALRKNPFAPEVPCHRVVASDLRLGGFLGGTSDESLEKKRQLLLKEGITFDPRGRVADRHLFTFREVVCHDN